MKKIFNFIAFVLTLSLVSCSTEDRMVEDPSELYFKDTNLTKTISSTVASLDVDVPYSLTTPADGSHAINLVFDPNFSTAEQGKDFEILGGDQVASGALGGVLKLRIFSASASSAGKIANFKLSSPTLKSLQDNNIAGVRIFKTCPISTFVGNFSNTGWLLGGGIVSIVQDSTKPNTLIVKGFLPSGADLLLAYDPVSYEITVPTVDTGDVHPTYGMIKMGPATDGTKSSFNSCNRTVSLRVNYFVSAGSFGVQDEKFTGQ
ncbi:hypothetical protein [uncultured Chryseobacterium sp.]|uniref:hypothetical protein n=1 Tax=uncultured Chryseobacterium sp. TaxID=259322 RepID=UPI0025EF6788|nr:hypothetical protein [uncultured Chryseobacterium sp.]